MEWWTSAYNWGWADKVLLKTVVGYGGLTTDQYKTITGETYSTGTATA